MKELRLAVQADFSDCAIEDSIEIIAVETQRSPILLELTVSVFDSAQATRMMLENRTIRLVHITKEFHDGRYCLIDIINDVMVTGGISYPQQGASNA